MAYILLFSTQAVWAKPDIYLFLGSSSAAEYLSHLKNPNIRGAQIIYSWKDLEPEPGIYDFSRIDNDLKTLKSINKLLFIQVQDKSFQPKIIPVPEYLQKNKIYKGGIAKQYDFPGEGVPIASGWVAKQWVPELRHRFQKLLGQLGRKYDGRIAGINLTETSIDLDKDNLPDEFSCNLYFDSIIDNVTYLKTRFHQSKVVQYVNFFPCEWNNDQNYMKRIFDSAIKYNFGLGGPDTVPFRKGHMANSYPYFHQYTNKLSLIAMAVQEPDYTYINTETGLPFTLEKLYEFSSNYLGASIIFWNVQEPQLSQHLIPLLEQIKSNNVRIAGG